MEVPKARTVYQSRIVRLTLSLSFGLLVVVVTWLLADDSSPLRRYFYSNRLEIPGWFSVAMDGPWSLVPALFSIVLGGFENPRGQVFYLLGVLVQWTAIGFAVLSLALRTKNYFAMSPKINKS